MFVDMKTLTALALLALIALPARAADDPRTADRIQIEDLMWKYTRALDTENGAAYAATYTPDGEFRAGTTATKGREALKKMVDDLRKRTVENEAKGVKRPPMYHMATNHTLEFIDKDHARYNAYFLTVTAAGGADTPARIAAAGREVTELLRVEGKWLIQSRDVAPKD
jgi:hypothetical protein